MLELLMSQRAVGLGFRSPAEIEDTKTIFRVGGAQDKKWFDGAKQEVDTMLDQREWKEIPDNEKDIRTQLSRMCELLFEIPYLHPTFCNLRCSQAT